MCSDANGWTTSGPTEDVDGTRSLGPFTSKSPTAASTEGLKYCLYCDIRQDRRIFTDHICTKQSASLSRAPINCRRARQSLKDTLHLVPVSSRDATSAQRTPARWTSPLFEFHGASMEDELACWYFESQKWLQSIQQDLVTNKCLCEDTAFACMLEADGM